MKHLWIILALVLGTTACKSGNGDSGKTAAQVKTDTIRPAQPDDRGYLVKVGEMAPDFTMTLTDGTKVTLSQLKGKVVMLQFTASWCGVCREEMPFIEKDIWLKNKKNSEFALLGIDRDEPLETVVKFAESTGITYPIGLDPEANIFGLYADKKAGITRNVIIDREGRIVMLTRLYNKEEFAAMVQKIEEQLKLKK